LSISGIEGIFTRNQTARKIFVLFEIARVEKETSRQERSQRAFPFQTREAQPFPTAPSDRAELSAVLAPAARRIHFRSQGSENSILIIDAEATLRDLRTGLLTSHECTRHQQFRRPDARTQAIFRSQSDSRKSSLPPLGSVVSIRQRDKTSASCTRESVELLLTRVPPPRPTGMWGKRYRIKSSRSLPDFVRFRTMMYERERLIAS
jgi:hypothetical protein